MTTTLSEAESKALLSRYGVKFLPEALVVSPAEAIAFAQEFAAPMALKLCGSNIAHKSERGLVHLGVVGPEAISRSFKPPSSDRFASRGEFSLGTCGLWLYSCA
jgi:acyl-CoA synthetase (NDP forming)